MTPEEAHRIMVDACAQGMEQLDREALDEHPKTREDLERMARRIARRMMGSDD